MPKLVLFDIDGTLVLTGGAGLRAMNRAFDEIVGAPTGLTGANRTEALNGIPVAGRTDWIIVKDSLARVGRELDDDLLRRLRERYVKHLGHEITQPGKGFNGTLPGVPALLETLQAREDVFLGLLTGNFRDGARIKLERFDLWRYFPCGAFGDDSPDRNALVPVALERAAACGMAPLQPCRRDRRRRYTERCRLRAGGGRRARRRRDGELYDRRVTRVRGGGRVRDARGCGRIRAVAVGIRLQDSLRVTTNSDPEFRSWLPSW